MSLTLSTRRLNKSASGAFRREKAVSRREASIRVLLTLILGICLWRATGMSYGYAARFGDAGDGGDTTLLMKLVLYTLVPLLLLYTLTEFSRVMRYIKSTPPIVGGIAAACILSIFVSINPAASIRGLVAVSLITLSVLTYRLRYGTDETWNTISIMFGCAAIANILYTIAFPQYAIMRGSYDGMVKGLFYHKNLMGHFSAISFFLVFLNNKIRYKFTPWGIFKFVATACSLMLVLLSKSSTAVMMIFAGFGVLAWLRFLRPIRGSAARSAVTFIVGVGGGVIVALVFSAVVEFISTSFGKDPTLSGRSHIWDQLFPLILDRPLLGYGFAMFRQPEVMSQFVHGSFQAESTHSTYIELCLNIGVPGAVLLVVLALIRLVEKAGPHETLAESRNIQAKELIVIALVLIASGLDAGMMLAPIILWPLLVIALVKTKPTTSPTVRVQPTQRKPVRQVRTSRLPRRS